MENSLRKGRGLQLEGLQNASTKVTVGFKCTGLEKIALANEAHKIEMTLSEYLGHLVSFSRKQLEELRESNSQLHNLTLENKQLLEKLAFYEQNPRLQRTLRAYIGKTVPFRDAETGQQSNLTINQVADVFQVMVSSIKLT
jgi:hypothetical protein